MQYKPDRCECKWKLYSKWQSMRSIDIWMDHGAEVQNSLKVATQFDRVIMKADRICAFIGHSIEYELRGHVAFARILV